ncbi:glycosyltransferase 87 family protein [Pseudonocardia sp. TRM90224]|uniref:glycosyltransferase 87 family protein n=1 Tax=Pseudonocardia sp. TRM90224 TaxID=2812678 RepID=UPI001E636835|nr:glycosyltransferase 87 family protein [Pseudonocardia sp. TRM90224]
MIQQGVTEQGAGTAVAQPPPTGREVSTAALVLAVVVGVLSAGLYAVLTARAGDVLHLIDLTAYRIGAQRVLDGVSLYDTPLIGTTKGVFEFVYPPFAALIFLPVALVEGAAFVATGVAVNAAVLVVVVWASLRALGYRAGPRLFGLSLAGAGLLIWVHPIWETFAFGQVNLLLAALVLVDLVAPATARWKGVLVGIAIGIKLTPGFFVVYLLVTRQYRAAATAVGSFVATAALGAIVMPRDSLTFWSGAFLDPARVGVPDHPGNQTLRGMIARLLGMGTAQSVLWLLVAVAVAVAGLWLSRRLTLDGNVFAAVVLCALTATAVSPFSWVHHWVWLGPLLILLLHHALRDRTVTAWAGFVVAALISSHGPLALLAPDYPTLLAIPAWHHLEIGYEHAYIWLTVALLVAAALRLRAVAREP